MPSLLEHKMLAAGRGPRGEIVGAPKELAVAPTPPVKRNWSRKPRPIIGECYYPQAKGRTVRFMSITDAGRWIFPDRPHTAAAKIANALAGRCRLAYDIRWRYEDQDWPVFPAVKKKEGVPSS